MRDNIILIILLALSFGIVVWVAWLFYNDAQEYISYCTGKGKTAEDCKWEYKLGNRIYR